MLPPVLSIRNGRRSVVITGTPEQLGRFELYCSKITEKEEAERKNKLRGGAVFSPGVPRRAGRGRLPHPASGRRRRRSSTAGPRSSASTPSWRMRSPRPSSSSPSTGWPRSSACTTPARSGSSTSDPSDTVTRLTAPVIRGLGVGIVPAATRAGQRNLFTVGAEPEVPPAWSSYAPTAVTLPDGSVKLSTKFTRLTGRSPILLAGMTPTTVDAKIVAAAANAGHWAELAGGGQVTEEIFEDRIAELTELLEPGRAVQFNTLFLDPYLWKLQVGGKRLVQKARQSGAPIDGVVVSAGIPDLEEAVELIDELNSVGISHVVFKPGTVEQIKSVIKIAAEVPGKDVIVHIEGGRAGGHHSWEDLDDLLLPPTPSCASCPTSPSASAAASAPRSGPPSTCPAAGPKRYGFPAMPVDGILVGTAAMATLEATTSPAVKQMLVETTGTDHWISAGKAQGGMASSRSQLGADIHEIDNAASRCGRLLDEVAGDAEAVAARRDEIIAAMADTAKPYFGDVGDMTYLQWLQRYVELAIGDGDSTADTASPGSPWLADTWRDRFDEMLKRAEARLHPQDSGPIETLFNDEARCWTTPERGDRRAAGALSRRRDRSSCTRPTCRSSSRCARRWASRSTSCPSSTRTCAAGGAATRCGRPTTRATPPTRCASSPARSRWRASPASTSRSASCWTASSRPPSTRCWPSGGQPVAGGVAPPGPRRRHRSARRGARLARRAVGRSHRHQPGAPHRCARRVAGQRKPQRHTPIHRCPAGAGRRRRDAERAAVRHLDRHPVHAAVLHGRRRHAGRHRRGRVDRDARPCWRSPPASTGPTRCRRCTTTPPRSPSTGIPSRSPTTPVSPPRSARRWRPGSPWCPTRSSAAAGPRCSPPSARRSPTTASRSSRAC